MGRAPLNVELCYVWSQIDVFCSNGLVWSVGWERQASCEALQLLWLSSVPAVKGFLSKEPNVSPFSQTKWSHCSSLEPSDKIEQVSGWLSNKYLLFSFCGEFGTAQICTLFLSAAFWAFPTWLSSGAFLQTIFFVIFYSVKNSEWCFLMHYLKQVTFFPAIIEGYIYLSHHSHLSKNNCW